MHIIRGIIIALNYDLREVLIIRARGGSKTHDMMCICLYFAYIGWRVIYFCSKASQMTQPKKYMRRIIDGSFLLQCIKKPHREFYAKETVEFEGGGTLSILNLTESKGRSPRCDIVLYDEESGVEEDAYMAAESILDGSDIGLTIHASTPVKASKFEENHDRLELREVITGHELIFKRNYDEIYFLVDTPAKRAKYAEKKRIWPGWYFRQELECSFELPTGAVFVNVDYSPYADWEKQMIFDQQLCSGLDWNPVNGHWLAGIKWAPDMKNVYITEEHPLGNGYTHEMTMGQYNTIRTYYMNGNTLTVEEGGINEAYVKWLKERDAENHRPGERLLHYEEWDNQGVNKMNACEFLMQNGICIRVDKLRFPVLAKQIEELHWDKDATEPKLAKDPADSPHALDAFLHAISKLNRMDNAVDIGRWY